MSYPVQLKDYFFPVQDIKANAKHKINEDTSISSHILRNLRKISDDNSTYSLELKITISDKDSDNPAYFIDLSVFGVFAVNVDNLDDNQTIALIESTGVSVLYGAARERVASLTSRGPWGVYFLDLIPLKTKSDESGVTDVSSEALSKEAELEED